MKPRAISPVEGFGVVPMANGAMAMMTSIATAPTRTSGASPSVATSSWENFFIGAAAGWSKDKVNYALGNSDGDSKSWQVGLYGGFRSGGFSADAQLAYISGSFDA